MSLDIEGSIPPFENTKLFGHDEPQAFLANAFKSNRIHHAILLEGEEGIGKATLAFRFANHILNHPEGETAPEVISDPDIESPVYRQIMGGASHNLMHIKCQIDAKTGKQKSAITVDDIRKTGKFFAQTSGSNNWRIAIIDVADDLNRSAANAILKILEEPPKRALFLVLSHSPGRLLPTIRSRCLSLRLRPLSDDDLKAALSNLDALDGLDDSNIAKLLHLSEGSVSRALTVLNYGGAELITLFNDIIDPNTVSERKTVHKLAESMAGKDQDVSYHFLIEHMIHHIMQTAKQAAYNGQLGHSAQLAELSEKLAHHKREADIYNLDKKQTLLTLFSMISLQEKA
jgi:DNA polymerase-3 subunit delta'